MLISYRFSQNIWNISSSNPFGIKKHLRNVYVNILECLEVFNLLEVFQVMKKYFIPEMALGAVTITLILSTLFLFLWREISLQQTEIQQDSIQQKKTSKTVQSYLLSPEKDIISAPWLTSIKDAKSRIPETQIWSHVVRRLTYYRLLWRTLYVLSPASNLLDSVIFCALFVSNIVFFPYMS